MTLWRFCGTDGENVCRVVFCNCTLKFGPKVYPWITGASYNLKLKDLVGSAAIDRCIWEIGRIETAIIIVGHSRWDWHKPLGSLSAVDHVAELHGGIFPRLIVGISAPTPGINKIIININHYILYIIVLRLLQTASMGSTFCSIFTKFLPRMRWAMFCMDWYFDSKLILSIKVPP